MGVEFLAIAGVAVFGGKLECFFRMKIVIRVVAGHLGMIVISSRALVFVETLDALMKTRCFGAAALGLMKIAKSYEGFMLLSFGENFFKDGCCLGLAMESGEDVTVHELETLMIRAELQTFFGGLQSWQKNTFMKKHVRQSSAAPGGVLCMSATSGDGLAHEPAGFFRIAGDPEKPCCTAVGRKVGSRIHHRLIGLEGAIEITEFQCCIADDAMRSGILRIERQCLARPAHTLREVMPSAPNPGKAVERFDMQWCSLMSQGIYGLRMGIPEGIACVALLLGDDISETAPDFGIVTAMACFRDGL